MGEVRGNMIKHNTNHQPQPVFYIFQWNIESAHRLIVAVPDSEAVFRMTYSVWELVNATGVQVKFLGPCNDTTQERSLIHTLVTMSAVANFVNVSAEPEVVFGRDWADALRSRLQTNDLVVCWNEQRKDLLRKPLSQLLQSNLDAPFYILSGLYPQNHSPSNWRILVTAWIGFIAIILGFFIPQIKSYQFAKEWTLILELLSTAVEFWSIWGWDNMCG